MKQCFRIAIKLKGEDSDHYIIRDEDDLSVMFTLIRGWVDRFDTIEYIKWVPIPDLEEVHHDQETL